ncbi:MAG: hypothetical protein WCC41_22780, partial [Rhodomicrobium sp.]
RVIDLNQVCVALAGFFIRSLKNGYIFKRACFAGVSASVAASRRILGDCSRAWGMTISQAARAAGMKRQALGDAKARPYHPGKDEAAQEAFKGGSPNA